MNHQEHVFVAMSGGVDSAVTASKLLEEGYQVTGIHMLTWKDPQWESAIQNLPSTESLAVKSAERIGIPFISLNVRDQFFTRVVKTFIRQYLDGQTPNPCLFCNPQIKWGILQTYALEHGGHYFATGHYAQIEQMESGVVRLKKGVDANKDQSYVLCMLTQTQLKQSILPLGQLTKKEVRAEAHRLGLDVADREDSQDLCFLGNVNYRDFLQRYAPEPPQPGEIITVDGDVVGEHQGLAFYTIGQRKGILIAATEPYYVIAKDIENNQLVIGFNDQAGAYTLKATHPNWISGDPPEVGESYDVMVRYRAKPAKAKLKFANQDEFRLEFSEKLRDITPGQVAAIFQGDVCLGGGVIQATG